MTEVLHMGIQVTRTYLFSVGLSYRIFHSGSLTNTSTAQSKDMIAHRCPRGIIRKSLPSIFFNKLLFMLHSLPLGKSEIPSSQWEYTFFTARKVGTGDFPLGNSGLLFISDFSDFDETADFPTFRAI